ncbi:MAG: hypothetical protein ACLR4W_01015 [Oscillospiraceae bacterium]
MTNPAFDREGLHDVTGCIVPVYPLTAGVGQSLLHRAIRQGLDEGADRLPDLLPAELRRQHGLCDVRYAYENIHFPRTTRRWRRRGGGSRSRNCTSSRSGCGCCAHGGRP